MFPIHSSSRGEEKIRRKREKTYVNGPETGTMSGRHILVESFDGIGTAHLTVLLVHVVRAGAGIVTDPDTEVLNLERSLLVDDVQRHNLAVGLLHFSQLHEEVPEAGLGDHGVGCEDTHAVQFGGRVGIRWQVAPDDLVFLKTTWRGAFCQYFGHVVSENVLETRKTTRPWKKLICAMAKVFPLHWTT